MALTVVIWTKGKVYRSSGVLGRRCMQQVVFPTSLLDPTAPILLGAEGVSMDERQEAAPAGTAHQVHGVERRAVGRV